MAISPNTHLVSASSERDDRSDFISQVFLLVFHFADLSRGLEGSAETEEEVFGSYEMETIQGHLA